MTSYEKIVLSKSDKCSEEAIYIKLASSITGSEENAKEFAKKLDSFVNENANKYGVSEIRIRSLVLNLIM